MDNTEELKRRIDQLTDKWSFTKYNLMRVGTLVKLIEETDKRKSECAECKEYSLQIPDMVEQLPKLDDVYVRSEYEKKFNQMRTHFHKVHGFIAPSYYSSISTLIGLLAVPALAALLMFIFAGQIFPRYLILSVVVGLLLGYLIGSIQDLKMRKKDRLI